MKKIYITLTAFVFATGGMNAQLTLTKANNEPVLGDVSKTKAYDSVGVVPKNTGTNLTWNFSAFTSTASLEIGTYTTVSSFPSGSIMTGADLAVQKGNMIEFTKSNGSNFEFIGMYDIGNQTSMNFTNTAIAATWPVALGNGGSDAFSGPSVTGTVTTPWSGTMTFSATGTGTVILPGNKTFTNCLQIVRTVTITMGTGTNTTLFNQKQYSYFAPGYKFPVAEYDYTSFTTGTVVTKEFNFDANESALTVGMKDAKLTSDFVNLYPNPASGNLYIKGLEGLHYTAEILDMTGKCVMNFSGSNSINVSSLNTGLYFVKLNVDGNLITKRVVISE